MLGHFASLLAPEGGKDEQKMLELQAAAESGPPTQALFKKFAKRLMAEHVLPEHKACLLCVLRTSLQDFPPADPNSPPPGFLASNLHLALTAVSLHRPVGRPTAIDPDGQDLVIEIREPLLAEAAAAFVHTLLQQPINVCLSDQLHGVPASVTAGRLSRWKPILDLWGDESCFPAPCLYGWLKETTSFTFSESSTADFNECWSTLHYHLLKQPAPPPWHLPGLEPVMAVTSLMLLSYCMKDCKVVVGSLRRIDKRKPAGETVSAQGLRKLVAMMEQEAEVLALPDGALAWAMDDYMSALRAPVCTQLLSSKKALTNLAQPLEALAGQPSSWTAGVYAFHVQFLDSLCGWAGWLQGSGALQQLAVSFAEPACALLSALLEQGSSGNSKSAPVLVGCCLRLVTHMACTDYGRDHISASGCIAQWLGLASRWKQQPDVLRRLLLLLQANFVDLQKDDTGVSAHLLQYLRVDWDLDGCRPKPLSSKPLATLMQQAASGNCIAPLSALLKADLDVLSTNMLLVFISSTIMPSHAAAIKPLVSTLLSYAAPSKATPDIDRALSPDLRQYLAREVTAHPRTFDDRTRLLAMQLVCLFHNAEQAGAGGLTAGAPPGAGPASLPMEVLLVMVRWLEVFQDGDRAREAGLDACCTVVGNLMGQACYQDADFLSQHDILQCTLRLLPHISSNTRIVSSMLESAGALLDALLPPNPEQLPWEQLASCSTTLALPDILAQNAILEAVLEQLKIWETSLCKDIGSGFLNAGIAGAGAPGGGAMSARQQTRVAARVLNLLGIAAASWEGRAGACRKLLQASPPWSLLKLVLTSRAGSTRCTEPWLYFLHKQLQQQADPDVQKLARLVLVEKLGKETVDMALQRASLRLPWEQYRAFFAQAAEQAAREKSQRAAQAELAAAVGSVTAAGDAATQVATGADAARKECCMCHARPERTFVCSRCKGRRYCSAACQKADWKVHKRVCNQPV